jgi:plasmid stability protein
MSTITVRNLDDDIKQALRERAARRGVSMEQEVRAILRDATAGHPTEKRIDESFMESINRLKAKYGAFDLDIPPRSLASREPPSFDR